MISKESIKKMISEIVNEVPHDTSDILGTDTADRDSMFQLFSRLICAKEMAHMMHLNAVSGGEHLMLEKIYEILDGMIDEFGEVYFMSRNIKIPLNPMDKANEYAEGKLEDRLNDMLDLAQNICKAEEVDDGTKSLVSDCMKNIERCQGFLNQANFDSED
jgi:DNA-binding ferritin-like protein